MPQILGFVAFIIVYKYIAFAFTLQRHLCKQKKLSKNQNQAYIFEI